MATYRHPRALEDVDGTLPASVDLHGESVSVADDGTFESDNETAVRALADAYGLTIDALRVQSGDVEDWADGGKEIVEEAVAFDPGDHTVSEVRDLVADVDNEHELAAIAELEREGKDRTTALDAIDARRDEVSD